MLLRKNIYYQLIFYSVFINYLGGVYAYIKANANTIKTTDRANVNIQITNMNVMQFGGVAGYAENIDITNSSVSGNFTESNANHDLTIGGIVGKASGVQINLCSSSISSSLI